MPYKVMPLSLRSCRVVTSLVVLLYGRFESNRGVIEISSPVLTTALCPTFRKARLIATVNGRKPHLSPSSGQLPLSSSSRTLPPQWVESRVVVVGSHLILVTGLGVGGIPGGGCDLLTCSCVQVPACTC